MRQIITHRMKQELFTWLKACNIKALCRGHINKGKCKQNPEVKESLYTKTKTVKFLVCVASTSALHICAGQPTSSWHFYALFWALKIPLRSFKWLPLLVKTIIGPTFCMKRNRVFNSLNGRCQHWLWHGIPVTFSFSGAHHLRHCSPICTQNNCFLTQHKFKLGLVPFLTQAMQLPQKNKWQLDWLGWCFRVEYKSLSQKLIKPGHLQHKWPRVHRLLYLEFGQSAYVSTPWSITRTGKQRHSRACNKVSSFHPSFVLQCKLTSKCATNIENCSNSRSYLITNTQVSIRVLSECYGFHCQIRHPAHSSFPPIFTEALFQFPIRKYNNYNKIETMWTSKKLGCRFPRYCSCHEEQKTLPLIESCLCGFYHNSRYNL